MRKYINSRRKLYQHLDRLAALKDTRRLPPVNVEIDLSNRCSRGCHFCHVGYTQSRGPLVGKAVWQGMESTGDLIDTDLVMSLLVDLEFCGVRSITWTGGGEPTLHPEFDLIVQAARIDQGLYTHGGHIDRKRAAILKGNCQWIYISLDYANAKDYAQAKGVDQNAFQESCEGVRLLVEASGAATIGLGFLLNKENYHQVWQMIELGWKLGVNYIQFRPTIFYDKDRPYKSNPSALTWLTDDFLKQLNQISRRSDVIIDVERFKMYRDWKRHGYEKCYWSGLQSIITPDGRVWGCLNKRGFPGYTLGDLNEETFADIWSRSPIQPVNSMCRVMCRGHIPNLLLQPIMETKVEHKNFI